MRWDKMAGIGLGILTGVAVIARGMANSARLDITEETVEIPGLPAAFDGFRLLHMTDVHLRHCSEKVEQLLALTEELDPDLVCLTGDYAFTALSISDVERFFLGLSLRPAVVGVYGNSDYRPGITDVVRASWEKSFPFLSNSALCLERAGEKLWIAGVDDPHLGRDSLLTAMELVPETATAILLAHSPEVILRKLDPRIKLILSGHTHGGQICLPNGQAIFNNVNLPNSFASGRHLLEGGATLYVSRGVGSTRLPVRFGCLPEVTVFTLRGVTPG